MKFLMVQYRMKFVHSHESLKIVEDIQHHSTPSTHEILIISTNRTTSVGIVHHQPNFANDCVCGRGFRPLQLVIWLVTSSRTHDDRQMNRHYRSIEIIIVTFLISFAKVHSLLLAYPGGWNSDFYTCGTFQSLTTEKCFCHYVRSGFVHPLCVSWIGPPFWPN